jgi:uncharacterized membrane protein
VLVIKYSLREKTMISLRVTVGVVLIFLEVCTFGFTEENASSINNATTTVIKNSSIFDDGTTKSFDVDSTLTTTISMTTSALPTNFQLPENCSDYKVLFTLYFHIIFLTFSMEIICE